jgi:phage shock protein A
MAGRLVEQVNRLIRAGIAHVGEEAPDPTVSIERSLHLLRDRLGKSLVERRRLAKRLADLPLGVSNLSGKVEAAVREGREDLARAALLHVSDMEQQRSALESDIAGLDADIRLLESTIARLAGEKQAALLQPDDQTVQALLAELDRLDGSDPTEQGEPA